MSAYRSPWLDSELDLLRDTARDFFEREFLPNDEAWAERGVVDREAWVRAGRAGLLCASVPDVYGGGGGDFRHEAVIIEAQGHLGISSFGGPVHSGMVAHYILNYGTDEQRRRWLPALASAELIGAICMTEPGAGSDLQGVQTLALRDGDGYVINGTKTFITNGELANLLVVVVKTDRTQGARGVSLLVVETDQVAGFRRGKKLKKLGQRGIDTTELFFDGVRVPAGNLLGGEEGKGFYQLMEQLPQERLIIALQAVAAMERGLELTVRYVKDRTVFGKRLIDFQNTRFKLAEVKTEAHIARVFIDELIHRHLAGGLDTPTAAMAKWWCTERQVATLSECVQLHGGYGYITDYEIARLYADSRVQMIYGGANEIQKELVARSL